jgi:ABC-type amino acid transport system permease subunit
MIEVVPRLLPGLRTTIEVSAISLVLATLIGI